MDITKRDGRTEPYDGQKIVSAISKAFAEVGTDAPSDGFAGLLAAVEAQMRSGGVDSVEGVQDLVERTLMDQGFFAEAKSYILYRARRSELRKTRLAIAQAAGVPELEPCLEAVERDFPEPAYALAGLAAKFRSFLKDGMDEPARLAALTRAAVELTSQEAPRWEFVAARLLAFSFHRGLAAAEAARGIDGFYGKLRYLTEQGLYGDYILKHYSRDELEEAAGFMRPERDDLFTYSGLDLLIKRYLICTHQHEVLESPQEMFLGIALHLAMNEGRVSRAAFDADEASELEAASQAPGTTDGLTSQAPSTPDEASEPEAAGRVAGTPAPADVACVPDASSPAPAPTVPDARATRLSWVRRFYDMLSSLEVTMATPTLANARKPFHQLSSCFIDTVPDSLEGIYRSVDNFAQVSKYGGGMGMYLGKVRAAGGSIRGFEGAAGGVIRWIRVINDTAVAVDQLGVRQGACAVYLDAWHRDLPEFLNLRTNNGDERMKAHDVFPAVCYPDLFWRMAKEDMSQDWYLMDPHDVATVRGYNLEDSFGEEWERRYRECVADPRIPKRVMSVKDVVRLVLKSAVETGTPFAFMRDAVNRANPNPQAGVIYCSNLCTEIAQNMSAISQVSREVKTSEGDTVVVTTTRPGDFVVCNLASLSLGHLPVEDDAKLSEVVHTAVRALDNVIDLNFYALPYAQITNHRYRSIGLGVSGYHHMLAKRGIAWESEEHLRFVDDVFERIGRHAIEASCELAAERGAYELFEGSDWQTGAYFDKRGYTSPQWAELRERVARDGMRNAYLMAVAPTSSTSILSGTTAGIDPVMRKFFLEEKKGSMLPRVAPELSPKTYWYYKPAHLIDQSWSVRASGVRQRHIDQAQSMNLYITNDFTMRQVLDLYLLAWESGVKTIYYVRSKSLEVEECESCAS